MMNKYVGHTNQLYGVEEYRISGGKGDGMRMLYVRNGKGLELWLSLDRCGDISRLVFKGDNLGYFSACGYVSPKYYDNKGSGFLKSFTAGFLTTCGLTTVGSPCIDNGEELPLHGTISNTPCENAGYWIENDEIHIKITVRDASLFSYQLLLEREYIIPLTRNEILMRDKVKNIGASDSPLQILYHCNIGYPLLSENSEISIPSSKVIPRDELVNDDIKKCIKVEKPQKGYEERCYYHTLSDIAEITVFNPDIKKEVKIIFDTKELPMFTQWKMLGEYDYVMGLEPGNCLPEGRKTMREKGILEMLKAGESKKYNMKFAFEERE